MQVVMVVMVLKVHLDHSKVMVVENLELLQLDNQVVQVIHHQFLHHKVIQDTKVHQILAEAVAAVVQVNQANLIVDNQVVQVVVVQQIQLQVLP